MSKKTLKDRLEDYFSLHKELPLIEDDIQKEKDKVGIAGTYQDGYGREHVLTMSTGKPKVLNSLLDRKQEINQELDLLETVIFNIPDSEMRQIFAIAYLNGGREKRWGRVADHFEREISGESYRKRADRYMPELEKIFNDLCPKMSANS